MTAGLAFPFLHSHCQPSTCSPFTGKYPCLLFPHLLASSGHKNRCFAACNMPLTFQTLLWITPAPPAEQHIKITIVPQEPEETWLQAWRRPGAKGCVIQIWPLSFSTREQFLALFYLIIQMQSRDFETGNTTMAKKADKMLIEDAQIKRFTEISTRIHRIK